MRKVYFLLLLVSFSFVGFSQSNPTDYFRSRATGNWNAIATWESSPDNNNWINATLTPNSAANTISIRNGHTVTLTTSVTVDQVIIETGGILVNAMAVSNILTIDDGPGNDFEIYPGGVYQVTSGNSYAGYQSINTGAIFYVRSDGIVRIGSGGSMTGGNHNTFVITPNTFVWETNSVFDWNTTILPGVANTIYFPDATSFIIPILRFSQAPFTAIGGLNPWTVNGVLEANASIIISDASVNTFRDGILGTGNITQNAGSGKLVINGLAPRLGGTGILFTNINGLEIGNSTTVTMTSAKTVDGYVSLLTGAKISVGNYDLTVTGTVSIPASGTSSYIKTEGTGRLVLQGISSGSFGKLFPIGRSTINPLYVNTLGSTTFAARVVEPITPPIYNDLAAVLRTWYIAGNSGALSAIIAFGYSYPGDCGPMYSNTGPAQIGVHIGGVWNIHESNRTPQPFPLVPGTFYVSNSIPFNYFTNPATEYPFVIANNGAILPLDYFIVATAEKSGNRAHINWEVLNNQGIQKFELQRSINNEPFHSIATIQPGQSLHYNFSDAAMQNGTNLYRVKMIRVNGEFKYSNTVAVLNGSKGILFTSVNPNPIQNNGKLILIAAGNENIHLKMFSAAGIMVKQWKTAVKEGTNEITIFTADLSSGIYMIEATGFESRDVIRIIKQND